jgi:hypothetical protein
VTEVLILLQPLSTVPHCSVCGGYAHLALKDSPVCAVCHAWYCGIVVENMEGQEACQNYAGPKMAEA